MRRRSARYAARRPWSTVEDFESQLNEVRSVRFVIRIAFDAGRVLQAAAGRGPCLPCDGPCQLRDAGLGSVLALGVGRRQRACHAGRRSCVRSCGHADAIVGAGSGVGPKGTLEGRLALVSVPVNGAVLVPTTDSPRSWAGRLLH